MSSERTQPHLSYRVGANFCLGKWNGKKKREGEGLLRGTLGSERQVGFGFQPARLMTSLVRVERLRVAERARCRHRFPGEARFKAPSVHSSKSRVLKRNCDG